ncbi:MAG: hypothetical protein OZ921_17380 [Sorangiineae bacterium]|nr:hypothetical protein [Polyangiaceae bacterium]MEB2324290.1 hypothetical protein [Sorangiineae bacterium]
MRSSILWPLALAWIASLGCSEILGLEERSLADASASTASGGAAGATQDGGEDGALPPDAESGAPIVMASGLNLPWGIATDATNIYVVSNIDGKLFAIDKTRPGAPREVASGLRAPRDLLLAGTSLYAGVDNVANETCGAGLATRISLIDWKTVDCFVGACGQLRHLGAGNLQILATTEDGVAAVSTTNGSTTTLINRNQQPGGHVENAYSMAAGFGSYLFIVNNISTIQRLTLGQPAAVDFAVAQPGPVDLIAQKGFLYWANSDGSVRRLGVDRPLEEPETLLAAGGSATRLALFGSRVYVTDAADGTITSALVGTAGAEVLAEHQASPFSIAADADGVYWSNQADGTVMMLESP